LEQKYTLNYLKSFNRFFPLPGDFISKQIIAYSAAPGKAIMFRSCIKPSEENFSPESASSNFMNVFIKTKVLFTGEIWNYEAYETDGNEKKLIDKGSISFDKTDTSGHGCKFNELNAICREQESGNEIRLIGMMREYAAKEIAVKKLFDI